MFTKGRYCRISFEPKGLSIAPKTLANFLERKTQLYEQGADVRRIGQYVRNWWRWVNTTNRSTSPPRWYTSREASDRLIYFSFFLRNPYFGFCNNILFLAKTALRASDSFFIFSSWLVSSDDKGTVPIKPSFTIMVSFLSNLFIGLHF